jgi:hypothetical protein
MEQEPAFATSRRATREKALAACRKLAPNADEDFFDGKALRVYPEYLYVWDGSYGPWCERKGLQRMPCPPEQLEAYVKYLWDAGRAPATIDRHVSAIATTLRLNKIPLDRLCIRERMKVYRKRAGPQRRARALVDRELQAMVARFKPESARDCRDSSILLTGFAFAGRGSEIVGLDLERAGSTALGCTGVLSTEHRGYVIELLTSKNSPGRGGLRRHPLHRDALPQAVAGSLDNACGHQARPTHLPRDPQIGPRPAQPPLRRRREQNRKGTDDRAHARLRPVRC